MTILVTGGAGYIGSITTAQLITAGYNVIVYDNLSKGHKNAIHPDAHFVKGDIADKNLLTRVLSEYTIHTVMHFAAFIEAGESMKEPERFFRNNTIGTLALLEVLIEQKKIPNFVFSSTAAVYGNPTETAITETSLLKPTNVYGESKLVIEKALDWYHRIHHLRYAALRYFNACGATADRGEQHQPETHLIPLALAAATGKRPSLKLFGTDYPTKDGTCVRDYIHVSDLASAHLLAMKSLKDTHKTGKHIYNLGNGEGYTVYEVIESVGRVLGKPVPYEKAPRRAGDPAVLIASSQKIQDELGWKPTYTKLDEIIHTAVEWNKKHPKGYQTTK